jgi:hypothetical protein
MKLALIKRGINHTIVKSESEVGVIKEEESKTSLNVKISKSGSSLLGAVVA